MRWGERLNRETCSYLPSPMYSALSAPSSRIIPALRRVFGRPVVYGVNVPQKVQNFPLRLISATDTNFTAPEWASGRSQQREE